MTLLSNFSGHNSLVLTSNPHLPYTPSYIPTSQDHAISIAVVHHFSSVENRMHALRELKRIVRVGGTVLVTVWAFEQQKKKYTEQDVMIKWHLQKRFDKKADQPEAAPEPASSDIAPTKVLDRYYHLFSKGELDELALQVGGLKIIESVWDVDNWYLLMEKTEE